jgi:hypothetical protein
MKTTDLPLLEELFSNSTGVLSMLRAKTKLSTTAELLLFTPSMIARTPGLDFTIVRYVMDHLTVYGLAIRYDSESIEDAVIRLWGSIEQAPTAVLNFSITNGRATYAHLASLDSLADSSIGTMIEEAKFPMAELGDIEALNKIVQRLTEWGLHRE